MKRKIVFLVTVGSHWPIDHNVFMENVQLREPRLPEGGYGIQVEVDVDEDETNTNMKAATDALEVHMKEHFPNESYHIWYWWWLS